MALTCDMCLRGDSHRCRRGDCANWSSRPARPERKPRSGNPNGGPGAKPLTTREQDVEIARLLVLGSESTAVSRHLEVPVGSVRRVRRALYALELAGVDAGPVEGERLPQSQTTRGPRAQDLSATTRHLMAQLSLEGHSGVRIARLVGCPVQRVYDVRRTLKALSRAA